MRSVGASILIGVAAFLIVAAGLLRFYAPSRAIKTPLDLNLKTVATGPATYGSDKVQLRATRHVRVDSTASDSRAVVVVETLCIVVDTGNPPECVSADDPKKRLVSLTTDRVAADRRSGQSINDAKYGGYINSDTSAKHYGLTYKWPFDAQKKGYRFFDPASRQAPVAKYQRTEKAGGIDCYVYQADERNLDVDVVPGTKGKYDDTRTVWIDPVTGTIVKGVEHQTRRLTDGTVALDTTLTFDNATIKSQAKQANDGRDKIDLLTMWLPLIALVLGVIALGVGIILLRGRRDGGRQHRAGDPPPDGDHDVGNPDDGGRLHDSDYEPTYPGHSQT